MHKNKKLCTWYFLILMSFTILCALVFLVMNQIERVASRLEDRIKYRNLSHIVDKNYKHTKDDFHDETDVTLDDLTEFFYNFVEKTKFYKEKIEDFMKRRKHIIDRFNDSTVKIYDLTVIPNNRVKYYDLKEHLAHSKHDPKMFIKQIPFSRQMKFKNKDIKLMQKNIFFMCTARLAVSSSLGATLYVNFLSTEDNVSYKDLMPYKIKYESIININRIIKMNNPRNYRITLKGFSNKLIKLHKVEAYCINFNDVSDEDVVKSDETK